MAVTPQSVSRPYRCVIRKLKPKPAPPEPQPPFRPISGYRADVPMPKIKKSVYLPGVWRGRGPTHRYILHIPLKEWKQLTSAAKDMAMPISLIMRLSYRRFLRAYTHASKVDSTGASLARAHADKLLSRAELAVAGNQRRGPHIWPGWKKKAEVKARQPVEPYEGAPTRPHSTPVPPSNGKRRLIVPTRP